MGRESQAAVRTQSAAITAVGNWSRCGLDLPDSTTFDEWLEVGTRLRAMEQSVWWWIGDWLLFGEHTFAERFAKAVELTGHSPELLKEARKVAAAYPTDERREGVSWSHYRIASSLPAVQRRDIIRQAEAHDWTCRDTRHAVARIAAGIEEGEGAQGLALPKPADFVPRRVGKLVEAAFMDWFGIGEEYARVVLALYRAGGKPQSWRDVVRAVSSHQPMARGALHEAISTLRETFESEAIDRDDSGYWLTDVGLAECRKAFRELAQQLHAMGAEPANDFSSLRGPSRAVD
jgi:hypothetical protein